jgi:hypothetical protein
MFVVAAGLSGPQWLISLGCDGVRGRHAWRGDGLPVCYLKALPGLQADGRGQLEARAGRPDRHRRGRAAI